MKDSGGERMHYPYGECILSPTDFVGIVSVLTLAGDVYVLGATYSANLAYTPASVSCSAA